MYTCCVIGCRSTAHMLERKFFRFPALDRHSENSLAKSQMRQKAWADAIRRSDFPPSRYKYAKVCDLHFVSGRSAKLYEIDDVDWVPTLNLGYADTDTSFVGVKEELCTYAFDRLPRYDNDQYNLSAKDPLS